MAIQKVTSALLTESEVRKEHKDVLANLELLDAWLLQGVFNTRRAARYEKAFRWLAQMAKVRGTVKKPLYRGIQVPKKVEFTVGYATIETGLTQLQSWTDSYDIACIYAGKNSTQQGKNGYVFTYVSGESECLFDYKQGLKYRKVIEGYAKALPTTEPLKQELLTLLQDYAANINHEVVLLVPGELKVKVEEYGLTDIHDLTHRGTE